MKDDNKPTKNLNHTEKKNQIVSHKKKTQKLTEPKQITKTTKLINNQKNEEKEDTKLKI